MIKVKDVCFSASDTEIRTKILRKQEKYSNNKKTMTHSLENALVDAALDNVLKSPARTTTFLSTLPVHLVHFREETARHLATN